MDVGVSVTVIGVGVEIGSCVTGDCVGVSGGIGGVVGVADGVVDGLVDGVAVG